MTFDWETPPWLRPVDSSYTATVIIDSDGSFSFNSTAVRGDSPEEALADLLMGPGGAGGVRLLPGVIAVVIKEGIDVLWMAQPPILVEAEAGEGEYNITVDVEDSEVTAFSVGDMRQLLDRLHAQYGAV